MKLLLPLLVGLAPFSNAATVVDAKVWFAMEGRDQTGNHPPIIENQTIKDVSEVDGFVIRDQWSWIGWGGGSVTIALDELETVTSVTMTGIRNWQPQYPTSTPEILTIPLYSGHASDTGAGVVYFDFANQGPAGQQNTWMWHYGQQYFPWHSPFTVTVFYTIETSQGTFLHDNGGNGWTWASDIVPEPSFAACAGLAVLMAGLKRRR